MVDNLFFSRCWNSSTISLRYSSSWIRRLEISRCCAAIDQIDRQQCYSCNIGRGVAETDGHAERAADDGCRDPDPQTTECGGEEYGRNIRGEKYVWPDQGK